MNLKKILFLVISIVFLFAACSNGNNKNDDKNLLSSKEPPVPQKVILPIAKEPDSLDASLFNYESSLIILNHISEPLIKYNENSEIVPALAEKWEVSEDGLKYRFILKESKWSNGTPVTANDFIFSIKRIMNKDNEVSLNINNVLPIKNANSYREGNCKFEEVGLKALDDKTLQIELENPNRNFLNGLTFIFPINEQFFNECGENYSKEPDKLIYNGPWKIEEWSHSDRIKLVKNDEYWNKNNIKLEEITFRFLDIYNDVTQFNQFLSNDLDLAYLATNKTIEDAKQRGLKINDVPHGIVMLTFNMEDPFFKNKNIRKAFSYAIDKKAYIEKIKNERKPAYGLVPPEIKGEKLSFREETGDLIPDDVSKARTFLEEGLKELGLKKAPENLKLTVLNSDINNLFVFFTESWKEYLGLTVEIESLPENEYFDKFVTREFQIIQEGFGSDIDPANYLGMYKTLDTGLNDPGYYNEEFSKLLDKAELEADNKTRMEILRQAEKMLIEDFPFCPIYFDSLKYVANPKLKGVVCTSVDMLNLYNAYVDNK